MRGSPNLHMMFFHKTKKIILLMVISTSASTSIHLVKYSTTNKTSYVLLEAFRNGPNISIFHCEESYKEAMVVNSTEDLRGMGANLRHLSHHFITFIASLKNYANKIPLELSGQPRPLSLCEVYIPICGSL